jgi:hypothetical protein
MVITAHGIIRRQNSEKVVTDNVSCSIISAQCLGCLLSWFLCGGTVRHCKQFSLRNEVWSPTDTDSWGRQTESGVRSSIYEKAHRFCYKGVFTRLLAVERTTSLLKSDIWRRPFWNAQSRVLKTLCTSNVWPFAAVRGVLVVFSGDLWVPSFFVLIISSYRLAAELRL